VAVVLSLLQVRSTDQPAGLRAPPAALAPVVVAGEPLVGVLVESEPAPTPPS
jgi:hypothetical protein